MIKAAIFDVDGTLIDSVDYHARAWQQALEQFGHKVDFETVRYQIGKGGDQLMPVFLNEQQLAEYGEELEHYRGELYKREYMPKVRPFPDVRELFERLKSDGKQIVLASSAKADEVAFYKKLLNVADLLDGRTSADDAERSKPHPDIFEAALDQCEGVALDEAIVVGDTHYDAIAAGRAGLSTIGVLCGGFPEQDLIEAGCIEIYRDPSDMLSHYEETPFAAKQAA